MTSTTASVKFSASGIAVVDSFLRLTGKTHIQCCTYPDHAPILAIDDAQVSISVTVPDTNQVTDEDLATVRQLVEAVSRYAAELEKFAAAARKTTEDPDGCTDRAA